jgi:hypothetical protein
MRARKRNIGKELMDCRYSKKAPASGRSHPDASSTNGTNRLGSSTAAPRRGAKLGHLRADSMLDCKRLTGEAGAGGVVLASSVVVTAAAGAGSSRGWDSSGGDGCRGVVGRKRVRLRLPQQRPRLSGSRPRRLRGRRGAARRLCHRCCAVEGR